MSRFLRPAVFQFGFGPDPEANRIDNFGSKTPNYNYQLFHVEEAKWTRSGFGGGLGMQAGNIVLDNMARMWDWSIYASPGQGAHVPKIVSGQVLDASSAPVAGATVQLFNTATGLLVDTQTSDSGGNYVLNDPNNVACFVVAYLSGSPDTAGTSVDTLTGT